ncbi:MAG: c-type cytochrome [Anaerolineales bacterium]|nr:c-type cytochrome [Anaerolineales bacterium]
MQPKIVIGTIAILLTSIILGLVMLQEPNWMILSQNAYQARSIESGAKLYAANCTECHGLYGQAAECLDTEGNSKPCQGIPLNSVFLLCDDPPARLVQSNFDGTTEEFIHLNITAGRANTEMKPWSIQFGGSLSENQIDDLTAFVLNWAPENCGLPSFEDDWFPPLETFLDMYESGNPVNGRVIYNQYSCNICHGDIDIPDSNVIGPWLGNITTLAGTRIEGMSAEEYIYESILYPNNFVASGPFLEDGPEISAMRMDYAIVFAVEPQDLADLLAFLLQFE